MKPQRIFLYTLIVSVIVSALLGIGALLAGGFGDIQFRVLMTTITIALNSVLGLACGVGLDHKAGQWLARFGIGLILLASAMIIGGIWTMVNDWGYWKVTACVAAWAIGFAHMTLLSRARLAERFRWSQASAYVLIPLLASQITLAIGFQQEFDSLVQFMGVTGILVVADTILIEIFHRLSRIAVVPPGRRGRQLDRAAIDAEIEQLQARIAELEGLRRQA